MGFPKIRMRDRRLNEETRKKYQETKTVSLKDLIMPVFVKEGITKKHEIKSMPGIYQFPLKETVNETKKIYNAGIPSVIVFGIPKQKDEFGQDSYDDQGIVQRTIAKIKKALPKLTVIGDVCMCEYTSHGHCGIIKRKKSKVKRQNYIVDNDATIEVLAKISVSYAKAGADIVAPSSMMDGQVKVIKSELIKNKFSKVKIMPYSAKYSSSFYGPFRDAAESTPKFGDRKTYQMSYYNSNEAVEEAKLDIEEGADILMVKPALGYQDIIHKIKQELNYPLACYSVSGEYSMIKTAASLGLLDEKKVVLEILTGFKRAGADFIISYYAKEAARWI